MTRYDPASLPEVTGAVVFALGGEWPGRTKDGMAWAEEFPRAEVDADTARELASLWRRLPDGQRSRCHIPPFAVRFLVDDEVVCEASICWKCDNVFIYTPPTHGFEFDGAHTVSQDLLTKLKAIIE